MTLDGKKADEMMLHDDLMEGVTGGTDEFSFSDFFDDEEFDKELVDDGTGK